MQIVDSGVLPGKQIQQLNGQTQRLLGQQSLAEFTRLKVDVDRIRADNNAKQGPEIYRKNGLITNQGGKLKPEALAALREANIAKYGLSDEQVTAIVLPDPPARRISARTPTWVPTTTRAASLVDAPASAPPADVLTVDVDASLARRRYPSHRPPRATDCPLWHWRQVRLRLT